MTTTESGAAASPFDVVVLGEVLLEVSTDQPVRDGVPARIGLSGDALNVAACAAGAGARVGLVCVLTDDDLGRAVAERVQELGISTELLRFRAGQQGVYLTHIDPHGEREFFYARRGSVGSTLSPEDLDPQVLAAAGAVLASGITCAVSGTARAAVHAAARASRRFVFDPNYRPRLTTREQAAAALAELAPLSYLVTPSFPGETSALLGCDTAAEAARSLRAAGAVNVAVTCGARGIHLDNEDGAAWVDALPAPEVVDQTGAGDAFVGTTATRLVRGDSLAEAARWGAAAASIVVGGRGGTGAVPTHEQIEARLATGRASGPEGHQEGTPHA